MHTKNIIFIATSILISGILIFSILAWNGKINSVAGQSLYTPFGGEITQVSYECCWGHIVTVDDKVSGEEVELMYYPILSTLYSYYQVFFPGPNVVGDYFPLGICIDIDDDCENISFTDGTIRQVGTSLGI